MSIPIHTSIVSSIKLVVEELNIILNSKRFYLAIGNVDNLEVTIYDAEKYNLPKLEKWFENKLKPNCDLYLYIEDSNEVDEFHFKGSIDIIKDNIIVFNKGEL